MTFNLYIWCDMVLCGAINEKGGLLRLYIENLKVQLQVMLRCIYSTPTWFPDRVMLMYNSVTLRNPTFRFAVSVQNHEHFCPLSHSSSTDAAHSCTGKVRSVPHRPAGPARNGSGR